LLSHNLEAQQWDVLPAVAAKGQQNDLRGALECVGHILEQIRLEVCTHVLERSAYLHVGLGRHGSQHAGREGPVTRIGKDARRAATDRVLLFAIDASHPGMPRCCVRQPAAVQDGHQNTLAVAEPRGHTRFGACIGHDLLWLRSERDVQNVIGRGYPLAERPVDLGAHLLHSPPFLLRELETSQPAQIALMFDRHAWHNRPDAIDINITNEKSAFTIKVVKTTSLRPIRRPGGRDL
jgi:hypothetical protein